MTERPIPTDGKNPVPWETLRARFEEVCTETARAWWESLSHDPTRELYLYFRRGAVDEWGQLQMLDARDEEMIAGQLALGWQLADPQPYRSNLEIGRARERIRDAAYVLPILPA